MKKKYQFYAVWNSKYLFYTFIALVLVVPLMNLFFLSGFVFILNYCLPRHDHEGFVNFLLAIATITSFTVSISAAFLLSNKWSSEYFDIKFDNKIIKIESKMMVQQVFPILQLDLVESFQFNSIFNKRLGVNISFEKDEDGTTQKRIKFEVNLSIFSNAVVKNSYLILQEFIDDFTEQVLKQQFVLVFSCEQTVSGGYGGRSNNDPARQIYAKNEFKDEREKLMRLCKHFST